VRSGRSLEEISGFTRISPRFLKAIEAEDFEALPGLVFARNFVRQYAAFLGLDPAPILAMMPQVDVENSPMPEPRERSGRPMWDPRWNSTFASIAWALLAVGAAVGAYIHFNKTQARPVTAQAAPAPAAPAPQTAATIQPVSAPVPAPESAAPPPSAHPVEVLVAAKEDSWVSASADGKIQFATILKAGENRTVEGDQLVKIRTGNAAGIDVTLNGKKLDPLGPEGQIRTITMTAEGLQPAPAAPAKETPQGDSSPL
jgi:cytoskeletal protein RodZ